MSYLLILIGFFYLAVTVKEARARKATKTKTAAKRIPHVLQNHLVTRLETNEIAIETDGIENTIVHRLLLPRPLLLATNQVVATMRVANPPTCAALANLILAIACLAKIVLQTSVLIACEFAALATSTCAPPAL
jgi:hypothetical protein